MDKLEDAYKNLTDGLRNALGDDPVCAQLIDTLAAKRFTFELEPWLDVAALNRGLHPNNPAEALLRPHDEQGNRINPKAAIDAIYQADLHTVLDSFITLAVIDHAQKQESLTVSINVSSKNAANIVFWATLHNLITDVFADKNGNSTINPGQIIFELLEDDVADDVSSTIQGADGLECMRALGYRFALDDHSHRDSDSRLRNLGRHLDFVKIDGNTLRAVERNEISMHDVLRPIHHFARGATVLCEWVRDEFQAAALGTLWNIPLVQGKKMNDYFTAHTPRRSFV